MPPAPRQLQAGGRRAGSAGWEGSAQGWRGRGLGLASGLRRPEVSTLDSNTKGLDWSPRPFSTADSGPAAPAHLPAAEMPGRV